MALIVTPTQLTRRSDLFHQLAQMTAAGLGLIQSIEVIHRSPPQPSMRASLARALAHLREGFGVSESLSRSGSWLSSFDIALIDAGEKSGRLPQCFALLATYYADRAQLIRQVTGFIIYPLFVFHFAVLLFPVSTFTDAILKGEVVAFAAQKILILAPLYGLALLLTYTLQSSHAEGWRSFVERILHAVPVLGKARRSLAIARLSVALEALLNAGVTIIEAWELAAAASGSPALRRVVANAKPHWINGQMPGETIASRPEFPSSFASLYQTGEISGQLDDALRRCHVLYQDEGSRKLKKFIFSLAGLLVGAVMLMIAFNIIKFYMGYFQQINDAINMNAK
ncbi:MAG TPA: type II secretion system F family protein [Candidatus Acidoferrum sp.]|nr:type II secretion system F family protein [Candidatus Acidoferrum sp.]